MDTVAAAAVETVTTRRTGLIEYDMMVTTSKEIERDRQREKAIELCHITQCKMLTNVRFSR